MKIRTIAGSAALLGLALLPPSVDAQVSDVTEIRLPRQHVQEFVELYAEMVNAIEASGEGVKPVSRNLLAHAWANDVALLEIITYATTDDLRADFNTDPAKINAYRETLSEAEAEAFTERWRRYRGLYLEGHTDETRAWVQDWGFGYDPEGHETHAHVVTRSKYWPTYRDAGEFLELFEELNVPDDSAEHPGIMVAATRHMTGSGANVDIWTVYESWSDFAASMTQDGGEVDEAKLARMFEIEGRHQDDIFVRVGTMNRGSDGTATFTIANE